MLLVFLSLFLWIKCNVHIILNNESWWGKRINIKFEVGDNIKHWHYVIFFKPITVLENCWKNGRKDVIFKLRCVCMCVYVKLLKILERNILTHVMLFFIKWHIYGKQLRRPVRNCKIFNPIVYILFRRVIDLWRTVEMCLTERRDIFISCYFSVKCDAMKMVEKCLKEKMNIIPTFENLHFSMAKHTRQWLKDTNSLSLPQITVTEHFWLESFCQKYFTLLKEYY